jgi:hypothetical protein
VRDVLHALDIQAPTRTERARGEAAFVPTEVLSPA